MNRTAIALSLALSLPLAACVRMPAALTGEYSAITPTQATERDAKGEAVRWGGTLAKVEPLPDRTCFQIVGRDLSRRGRPYLDDQSSGRFLACRKGFYDPQVFAEGRLVTVVGRIDGAENRDIGEYPYLHPRVAADVVYLWPEEDEGYGSARYSVGVGYNRY